MTVREKMKLVATVTVCLAAVLGVVITVIDVANSLRLAKRADDMTKEIFERVSVESSKENKSDDGYFTVTKDGEGFSYDIEHSAIGENEALEMAAKALKKKSNVGYIGNYRYKKVDVGGSTVIIFLNCYQQVFAIKSFALLSVIISLVAVLAAGCLTYVLSPRIMNAIKQ